MHDPGSIPYEPRGFARITAGKASGYRIDIGIVLDTDVLTRGPIVQPARMITRLSLFCHGDSYNCQSVVSDCVTFVDGKTLFAYHGRLEIKGDEVASIGDRRIAGTACSPQESIALGWN